MNGSKNGNTVCTTNKVNRRVIGLLKDTGQPFELKDGGSHIKVVLADKFIGVICKCGKRGRETTMIEKQIEKRLKELQCS